MNSQLVAGQGFCILLKFSNFKACCWGRVVLLRYEIPQIISTQNISPGHVSIRLLWNRLCPVEILHTGTSACSPAGSLGKCGLRTP